MPATCIRGKTAVARVSVPGIDDVMASWDGEEDDVTAKISQEAEIAALRERAAELECHAAQARQKIHNLQNQMDGWLHEAREAQAEADRIALELRMASLTSDATVERLQAAAATKLAQVAGTNDMEISSSVILFGPERPLAVSLARFKARGVDCAGVCFAADRMAPKESLIAHWATAAARGAPWDAPPPGWVTWPGRSSDAGNGAWQTPLESDDDAPDGPAMVVFAVPLAGCLAPAVGGGLPLVIRAGHEWLKDAVTGDNLYIDLPRLLPPPAAAATVELPAAATEHGADDSHDKHGRHGKKHQHAEGQDAITLLLAGASPQERAELAARERATSASPSAAAAMALPRGGLGAMPGLGPVDEGAVAAVVGGEHGAQRSLMHRFNTAAELAANCSEGDAGALAALTVWLRMSAARLLVWNRNYNVKPREISAAQDRLTNTLAARVDADPHAWDLLRLALAAVGRGGQGNVGQRIRDEILAVQQRNHAKGGMMEEWHQKLHNNTSPDDVDICEALIAYIDAGLDVAAYWGRLHAANIDAARLASYDRAIRSEPRFSREQAPGLRADLAAYLQTLKAVHSGTDLHSAALDVFGYQQAACKGKPVEILPVDSALTPGLKSAIRAEALLSKAEAEARAKGGNDAEDTSVEGVLGHTLRRVGLLLEARHELRPAVQGGRAACRDSRGQDRLRDVLYLDIALEDAIRTHVEAALGAFRAAVGDRPMPPPSAGALLLAALENAMLSVGSNATFVAAWADLCVALPAAHATVMSSGEDSDGMAVDEPDPAELHAVLERLQLAVAAAANGAADGLGPTARALGRGLEVPSEAVETLIDDMLRGSPLAPVSQMVGILKPAVQAAAGLGDWSIVSAGAGPVAGEVVHAATLAELQSSIFESPAILVVDAMGGDEEPPMGAVAIVTRSPPDVLCHAAIRARQEGVLLAACSDASVVDGLAAVAGSTRHLIVGSGAVEISEASEMEISTHATRLSLSVDSAGELELPLSSSGSESDGDLRGSPAPSQTAATPIAAPWCGRWALAGREAVESDGASGAKTGNLVALEGALPKWARTPAGVSVPAGAMEALLEAPVNASTREGLARCADGDADCARAVLQAATVPREVQGELLHVLLAEGILNEREVEGAMDGVLPALKRVWASKWNERAALACAKAGIPLSHVRMAVLCQRAVDAQHAFVVHTTHPLTGSADEMYIQVVQGLGESLVGNHPGRPLTAVVNKTVLSAVMPALQAAWDADALADVLCDPAVRAILKGAVTVECLPSKVHAIRLATPTETAGPRLFLRSDSNAEDLPEFAGAGLFDSHTSVPTEQVAARYHDDPLVVDEVTQTAALVSIAAVSMCIESALGGAQDIEGAFDTEGNLVVLQARPQV